MADLDCLGVVDFFMLAFEGVRMRAELAVAVRVFDLERFFLLLLPPFLLVFTRLEEVRVLERPVLSRKGASWKGEMVRLGMGL